jgi:hypothetical protein
MRQTGAAMGRGRCFMTVIRADKEERPLSQAL